MDTLAHYRQIIRERLLPLVERRYANADITNEAVFDEVNDRYLIMSVGCQGRCKRVHGCLAQLQAGYHHNGCTNPVVRHFPAPDGTLSTASVRIAGSSASSRSE